MRWELGCREEACYKPDPSGMQSLPSEGLPTVADVFFRYVRAEVATLDDFKPHGALGKKMIRPGNQETWDRGISVWDTFENAYLRAREIRFSPGSYIVEISLPEEHGLRIEGPSGWRGHHYTIYDADPEFLLDCAGDPVKMEGAP
jgi:hypothetical protein